MDPQGQSGKRVPWVSLSLAIAAAITFVLIAQENGALQNHYPPYPAPMAGSGPRVPPLQSVPVSATDHALTSASRPYYPYNPTPPVADTREFDKLEYQATIRTREVAMFEQRIETEVRGWGGRVDSSSSSHDAGYVQFVVPASKFDTFRSEAEGMVNWRFLTATVNSQNLLPQKQNIEAQQKDVQQTIDDLTASRKTLVASHARTAASLKAQLDTDAQELAALRAEITSDPAQQAQMSARISVLTNDQSSLNAQLAQENTSYATQLNSLDARLSNEHTAMEAVTTQNQNLLDTVATVQGTITLTWIGWWDIAQLYLPGYSIPGLLALAAVLNYLLWERRRAHPVF